MRINRQKAEIIVRRSQELWKRYGKHADIATKVLRDIQRARNGGMATKLVAAASIAGTAIKAVFPELSIEEELTRQGYHEARTGISGFLCGLVDQHKTPTRVIANVQGDSAKVWERNGSGIAVVYRNDEYSSGPYLLAGDDGMLVDVIVSSVWQSASDLMIEKPNSISTSSTRWGYRRYSLTDIPEPGPYIGEPGPKYWADRIALHKGKPRTILIKGPSGVGKSVLARHIGRIAGGGESRTLKVTGEVLRDFRSGELRDIVKHLQPSVLLLDDLKVEGDRGYYGGEMTESLLGMFEALRVDNCTVIATRMEHVSRGNPRRGEHYVSGMRPGRVDLVIAIPAPNSTKRDEILRYYFDFFGVPQLTKRGQNSLVKMTQGLTGAYLRECAERVSLYGTKNVRDEIVSVLQTAPTVEPRRRKKGTPIRNPTRKSMKMSEQLVSTAKVNERMAATYRNRAERLERQAKERREKAERYAVKEKEKSKQEKANKKKKKVKKNNEPKVSKSGEELSKVLEAASDEIRQERKISESERKRLMKRGLLIVNPAKTAV